ncbi:MAG: hypothetical protein M3Y72_17420 [Acidobacteriota bacterium]|nr:hypothetical protein [Acidobacteriota bacterium]
MHPELEDFLEAAFDSLHTEHGEIGRVVVEPDYDVEPEPGDSQPLAEQLTKILHGQELKGDSVEVEIPDAYALVKKYIRSITLHSDKVEGDWVEVAPPGNWI